VDSHVSKKVACGLDGAHDWSPYCLRASNRDRTIKTQVMRLGWLATDLCLRPDFAKDHPLSYCTSCDGVV
jgi:hypothetical protein